MSGISGPKIITSGCVLALDAADKFSYPGSGTTWTDLSGNGNTGTLTNGPTFSGANGGCIVFDGVDDYVELSDVPFRISNYNFSIEVIFYDYGGNYTNVPLLGKRNPNANYNQYNIGIYNGDPYSGGTGRVLSAFLRDDSNPNSSITDRFVSYTLPNAGIYHVTLINSQSSAELWVNGLLKSTSTVVMNSGNFGINGYNFRIATTAITTFWNQKIYLVRFYNKSLTASEVLQNYNATKARFGR